MCIQQSFQRLKTYFISFHLRKGKWKPQCPLIELQNGKGVMCRERLFYSSAILVACQAASCQDPPRLTHTSVKRICRLSVWPRALTLTREVPVRTPVSP